MVTEVNEEPDYDNLSDEELRNIANSNPPVGDEGNTEPEPEQTEEPTPEVDSTPAPEPETEPEPEPDYKKIAEQREKDIQALKGNLSKMGEKLKAMEESSVVDKDFKVLTDDELIELSELDPVKHAQYVTDLAIYRVNEKRQADAQVVTIKQNQDAAFDRLDTEYGISGETPEKLEKIVDWMNKNNKSAEELTPELIDMAFMQVFPEEHTIRMLKKIDEKKAQAVKDADVQIDGGSTESNTSKFPGIDVNRLDDDDYLDTLTDDQLKALATQDEGLAHLVSD